MEKALAERFRPILYMHPAEPYMPIDFTAYVLFVRLSSSNLFVLHRYINASRLKRISDGAIYKPDQVFDSVAFGQFLHDDPQINSPAYTLFLPEGTDDPVMLAPKPTATTPLYVNYRRANSKLYISYTHMYAYNGPEPVCCCVPIGMHFADSEHVTAELDISARGDVMFSRMYMSRHSGGVWLDGSDLRWNGDRPLVFPSLNGHASYESPGPHPRYWGAVFDRCDYGIQWDTDTLQYIPTSWDTATPEDRWMMFRGKLGDGAVDGFGSKTYVSGQDEVPGEYGASCAPWKWLA